MERAKTRLVRALVAQLRVTVAQVESYAREIERFFASLAIAPLGRSLPGGKGGTTVAALWAELGDAPGRWASFQHLQAESRTSGTPTRVASI